MSGLFISFEGADGCGKSTQKRLLVDRLRSDGHAVVENQEPGGTAIGVEIRRLLLESRDAQMDPNTELLLMFASRAQAAAEIIRPALTQHKIVVSDRFTDSSLAYQGHARGLGFDKVLALQYEMIYPLLPDVTIYLDVELELGLDRARRRNVEVGANRLDEETLTFHRRVKEGYSRIAQHDNKGRFRIVDGHGTVAEVHDRVVAEVSGSLAAYASSRLVSGDIRLRAEDVRLNNGFPFRKVGKPLSFV